MDDGQSKLGDLQMTDRPKQVQAFPAVERYAATVLAVVSTLAIRVAFDPILGDRAPYIFFFLTIIVVKRFWGRGPGLLATLLGGIAAWYFLVEPRFSFAIADRTDALNLAAYFAVGAVISFLGEVSAPLPASVAVGGRNIKPRVIRQTGVLAGAVVILAGMALLLLRDFRSTQDAERWVAHTYEAINSAESLMSKMKDAESGERGYLLTGDERFLEPYNAAIAALPIGLRDLKDLTSDDPHQQARLVEIGRLIEDRKGMLKYGIELRKASGVDAAMSLVRSGQGIQVMDKLRSVLDALMAEERQLLVERTARAKDQASRGRWVLGLGSAAMILLLVFASMVIERETVRREQITADLRHHAGLLEQAHDSLLTCRLGGAIGYWSRGAETLFGYSREEAVGRSSHELLQTYHPLGTAWLDSVLERDGEWKGELIQTTKDGRKLIVEAQLTAAVDAKGNKTVLEANRDITERKRAEAQNLLLATAIEQAAETVVITDRDANIQYVNPAFTRTTGYTRAEALGQNPRLLKSGLHDAKFYQEMWAALIAGKLWRGEVTNRRKDGTLYMEEATIAPVRDASGEITHYIAIKSDITERKQAEEALRQSEAHFRSLFDHMLNGFAYCQMLYEQDKPHDFIYLSVNKAFEVLTGLKNVEGKKVSEIIPGIQKADPVLIETYGRVASTGVPQRFETYVEALAMWFSIAVYSPKKGYFVAVFDVITERKQAEKALEESELRYRQLFERSESALALHEMIFDGQGNPTDYRFLDVNPAFERQTGLIRSQTVGHTALEILPGLEEFWIKLYGRVTVTGEPAAFENYTHTLGRYYAGSVYSPRPNHFAVSFMDVTERKRAEEEVRQLNVELEERVRSRTAELEAANRELEAFAHSVSHDLRAPLRGIDGWSLALLEDCGERL
ncbi:MAG TPA: PAS domain S-box protein, partial [Terriglobia bacterium]|nr:PAS domain S-box protein [Terriglobia bacterium]